MNKKIISFLLATSLFLGTGCGSDYNSNIENDEEKVTLSSIEKTNESRIYEPGKHTVYYTLSYDDDGLTNLDDIKFAGYYLDDIQYSATNYSNHFLLIFKNEVPVQVEGIYLDGKYYYYKPGTPIENNSTLTKSVN